MTDALWGAFAVGLIAATLRVATPLIYGTIGEIITERSGVLNLGIEGIMFLGAFVGFAVAATLSGSGAYLWLGLGAAVLAGMLMGALMGLFAVTLALLLLQRYRIRVDWGRGRGRELEGGEA